MQKKSYYLKNGLYYDITTGRTFERTGICELTGERTLTQFHHKLSQHKCIKDLEAKKVRYPSTWTQEFINENQRIFELSPQAHADIHSMSDERFYNKYGVERSNYIWQDK